MDSANHTAASLLCSIGDRLYAIPIAHVVETMRPLPVEPIADAPPFVRGLAIVRGVPVPVVDGARLVGIEAASAPGSGRFVTVRVADRHVVLTVDRVLGVREFSATALHALPPLLRDAADDVVAAIGALDAQLLFVLRALHLVSASVAASVDAPGAS